MKRHSQYFAGNLSALRKSKGLSQDKLAFDMTEKCDIEVTRAALSSYEEGRSEPTPATLKTLADYFGVTMDDLYSKSIQS